jgi:hypothetical protein
LERLRAERALRQAAWQSFEPDPAFADLAGRAAVSRALADDRSRRAARFARRASGVAAGLLIAFAGGWVARGRAVAPGAPSEAAGSSAAVAPAEFQVALTDEGGRIIAVQHFHDARQAREFAEDVGRWQSRAPREDAGDFSQVSDEF